MPACCAAGCTNRYEKGFKMYRFPSDPLRRKTWENKVGRVGWKSSSSSFLCEVHFEHQQFENGRADAKRKLRCSAVPTLFLSPKPRKKDPKKRRSTSTPDKRASQEPATAAPTQRVCAADPLQQRISSCYEGKASEEEDATAACRPSS